MSTQLHTDRLIIDSNNQQASNGGNGGNKVEIFQNVNLIGNIKYQQTANQNQILQSLAPPEVARQSSPDKMQQITIFHVRSNSNNSSIVETPIQKRIKFSSNQNSNA